MPRQFLISHKTDAPSDTYSCSLSHLLGLLGLPRSGTAQDVDRHLTNLLAVPADDSPDPPLDLPRLSKSVRLYLAGLANMAAGATSADIWKAIIEKMQRTTPTDPAGRGVAAEVVKHTEDAGKLARRLLSADPGGDHVNAVAAAILAHDEELRELARTSPGAAQYRADEQAVAQLDSARRALLPERERLVPSQPTVDLSDDEIEVRSSLLMLEDPEVRELARTDRPAALLKADEKAIEQLTREKRQAVLAAGGAK